MSFDGLGEFLAMGGYARYVWGSYGLGILWVEPLNRFRLGGFPLGFWFAQQGSIYVFVVLILVYAFYMDWLDRRYGVDAGH